MLAESRGEGCGVSTRSEQCPKNFRRDDAYLQRSAGLEASTSRFYIRVYSS